MKRINYKKFTLVINDENENNNQVFITIGNNILYKTTDEKKAKKVIDRMDTDLLINLIALVTNTIIEKKEVLKDDEQKGDLENSMESN